MRQRLLVMRGQFLRRVGPRLLIAIVLSGLVGILAGCSQEAEQENVLSDNLYARHYGPVPLDLGGVRMLDAQNTDWPNDASIPVWTCWGATTEEAKARLNATLLKGVAADSNCDFDTVNPEDYVKVSS